MLTKDKILEIAKKRKRITTQDIVLKFSVSRQYANSLISDLVSGGTLVKVGSTRNAFYVTPEYAKANPEIMPNKLAKTLTNKNIEEHQVLEDIKREFSQIGKLPENVGNIFTYAFSEMLNNAIEHSSSQKIKIELFIERGVLTFVVDDFGIGVFKNIMKKKRLGSELEAIQDLLKGKTTTMPKSHSGEGIFFTSKVGDLFLLESYGLELIIDNKIQDVFVKKAKGFKKGTRVIFRLNTKTKLHLNDVFKEFTNLEEGDYGFNKTEIRVKLYTAGGVHISRSQARRILHGLDKFKVIVLDFEKVPIVGQAFCDEIFRVFKSKHPDIKIITENMVKGVRFMVERAISEAKK